MCNKNSSRTRPLFLYATLLYRGDIGIGDVRGPGPKIKLTSQRKSLVVLGENADMFELGLQGNSEFSATDYRGLRRIF